MLDLHEESGLAAIRACDLYEDFLPLTSECGQETRVLDAQGTEKYSDAGDLSFRPEISRHALTGLLLSRIPEESVRWGWKLLSATQRDGEPTVYLDFGPRGVREADLVVGADGAWSKVRTSLLPDAAKPVYSGVQNLTITATHISTRYPHLAQLLGGGTIMAMGHGRICSSHRGAQDSARLYVAVGTPDEDYVRTQGYEGQTAAQVAEVYLSDPELFGRWGEALKDLIRTVAREETERNPGEKADIRGIYELPAGCSWKHRGGVTVLGDAAHVMTPWGGEGANVAMWDSLDLAGVIGEVWEEVMPGKNGGQGKTWSEVLDPKIESFEKVMTERAGKMARESSSNGQVMFKEDGAEVLAKMFMSFGPPSEE